MKKTDKIKYRLGKSMADDPNGQLKFAVEVIVVFSLLVVIIGILSRKCNDFWSVVVSFLSPAPINEQGGGWSPLLNLSAYIIGLIAFSGISIATITTVIRTIGERYTNGTAKYKLRGHVLFLGFDDMEIGTLLKELTDEQDADIVVAVPKDVATIRNTIYQYLTNKQSERVIVIQVSRVNVDDLRNAAQVQMAKRVYIIGQADEETHDAINLKCISLVAGLCALNENKPQCMYYMRNQATFSMVQRQGIGADDLKVGIEAAGLQYDKASIVEYIGKYCEPFNFYEIAARRLLFNMKDYDNSLKLDWYDEKKNLNEDPDLQPHLVILGMTEMGTALAREVLMTIHYPNKKLIITFVDDNAYEEMHYFTGKYKSFFDNCKYTYCDLNNPKQVPPIQDKKDGMRLEKKFESIIHNPQNDDFLDVEFEFLKCDVAHPELHDLLLGWAEDKNRLLTVAVCTNDTPKNMAFALYLSRPILANVPIWVYQRRDDSMNTFIRHDIYENVKTFSLTGIGIATPDAPEYIWAKEVADIFDKNYGGHKSWSEKSASDRWSSLYNALSIIIKIRLAGFGLTISDKGELRTFVLKDKGTASPLELSEDQIRVFSIVEHSRWNSEKLMMGFKPSSKEEHEALKEGKITAQYLKNSFIHDDIRSFEKLDSNEQEKDFVLTRAIIEAINNPEPYAVTH